MKILVDGSTSLQQISVKDTNRFWQIKCIQRKTNTCVTLLTQLMHSPFSDRYSAYATSAKIFDSQLSNYFDTLTTILTEIINYFKCRGRSFLAVNPSTKQQYIQFSEIFFFKHIFLSATSFKYSKLMYSQKNSNVNLVQLLKHLFSTI